MIVYETHALVKRYPGQVVPAVDGISLQIFEGEIFGLLGNNGAGKTTFVRQLVSLERPTTGWVAFAGRRVEEDPVFVAMHVGYMPHDARALGALTVGEALYFTAHLRGMSRQAARAERDRLLDLWSLGELRSLLIRRLSAGQRRLSGLAVAMAGSPRVLVLDEPTNELDPVRRHQAWGILRSLREQHGVTIILVTHDAIEAERVIDRVGIMRAGKLVANGRPETLKRELDRRIRLEVRFAPDRLPAMPENVSYRETGPGRWVLLLDRSEIASVLPYIADLDFNMHSATLEDLYMHHASS